MRLAGYSWVLRSTSLGKPFLIPSLKCSSDKPCLFFLLGSNGPSLNSFKRLACRPCWTLRCLSCSPHRWAHPRVHLYYDIFYSLLLWSLSETLCRPGTLYDWLVLLIWPLFGKLVSSFCSHGVIPPPCLACLWGTLMYAR